MTLPNLKHIFLPARPIFFAEFGGGPAENFTPESTGEGGGGVSEAASEMLLEELRRTAAAQKRDDRGEQKARKRDDHLAKLLAAMLGGGASDDLMLLISRLLKRNCPVSVILAILSLNQPEIETLLADYLEDEQIPEQDIQLKENIRALALLDSGLSEKMDRWSDLIYTHAAFYPIKSILALAEKDGVNSSCIQLTVFIIDRFLQKNQMTMEHEKIRLLANTLWRAILKKVHRICEQQMKLEKPKSEEKKNEKIIPVEWQ